MLLEEQSFRLVSAFAAVLFLCHCAGGKNDPWSDIDYSKVRNRGAYENDSSYRLPTVSGCASDDLYTCN